MLNSLRQSFPSQNYPSDKMVKFMKAEVENFEFMSKSEESAAFDEIDRFLSSQSQSLLKKYLTKSIWEKYQDKESLKNIFQR
jgi:hypothetical protein